MNIDKTWSEIVAELLIKNADRLPGQLQAARG
jgi:hypothetical protein